jgi:hypothetical protein
VSKFKGIILVVLGILIGTTAAPAWAQSTTPPTPTRSTLPPTPGDVRREARQLASDLDDPNYDWTKAPKQFQQYFADFRAVLQDLGDDERRQFAGDIMQQMMPVMQKHADQIQKAIQMAFLLDLQKPLGCSDDEFAAVEPLLQNVVSAQQELQGGRQRMARFFGQQLSNQALSPVEQATTDLQAALDDTNSSPDLIQTKLDALRHARDAARQNLRAAQDALRQVLTERQEAELVSRGMLD